MQAIKGANLAVTFILELCLLVAFGYWGFTTGDSLWLKILLGIGTPVLAAVLWGLFMAPKAARRLPSPWHEIAQVVFFALGTAALYAAGQPTFALLFAVVFAVNFVLRLVWKQSAAHVANG